MPKSATKKPKILPLRSGQKFNRKALLATVLLVAAAGGYLVYRSLAATLIYSINPNTPYHAYGKKVSEGWLANANQSAHAWYGPYVDQPSGYYTACYHYTTNSSRYAPMLEIDATANNGQTVLASQVIKGSLISNSSGARGSYCLGYNLGSPIGRVEWRMKVLSGSLTLRAVKVTREGGTGAAPKMNARGAVAICRYWSATKTDHFFTRDCRDYSRDGYAAEGIEFYGFLERTPPFDSSVCRYWSAKFTDHFYTTDCKWYDGYQFEQIEFWTNNAIDLPPAEEGYSRHICRYFNYNPGKNDHHYERSCKDLRPAGYTLEQVPDDFYAPVPETLTW